MHSFAGRVVRWQRRHGRHDLPWQRGGDPYRVWLSEVMLQQTRVETVIPYFERFLARFPGVRSLARAPLDEVLRLWSGLGYYARARNLHAAARQIVERHGSRLPDTVEALQALPGIGRSSAGAIAALAFGRPAPMLDANAKRVLARCFGVEGKERLWSLAESLLPARSIRPYTQGLMDLGATVCARSRPRCEACPAAVDCVALRERRIDELPARKAPKDLPLRAARWLLLVERDRVLLERRPARGLWGGLWVFPQLDRGDVRATALSLGCRIEAVRRLPVLEHGFTHFRLKVEPLLCRAARVGPGPQPRGRRWVGIRAATREAVPVPVRKLLQGIPSSQHVRPRHMEPRT